MKGRIISVNISDNKGEKKHNVEKCRLIKDIGLENDAHAGFMHRQVSLLAIESIKKMREKNLDVHPGDFAENITTEGIDLVSIPVGTLLKAGSNVTLRISQIGKVCHARCAIFQQTGDCIMPKEGIFAEVLEEGEIKVGDEIQILNDKIKR
ncbi:MAG TPA: MOSC domain-containing protein [Syntrophorhabdaceae bacterium]|nr:MOSC domain-containing protein [Syntrophorhabdaceae bacterium]